MKSECYDFQEMTPVKLMFCPTEGCLLTFPIQDHTISCYSGFALYSYPNYCNIFYYSVLFIHDKKKVPPGVFITSHGTTLRKELSQQPYNLAKLHAPSVAVPNKGIWYTQITFKTISV